VQFKVIPFRFHCYQSADAVEAQLCQHVRDVSFFVDPIELARVDKDRSWLEPRLQGVVRNGRFRIWLSELSAARQTDVRGSFAGVLHGRISNSNGATVVSGFVRPSVAGTLTIGALIFAIINRPWLATNAPAPIQGLIYALFLFAMVGVVVASLVRPLVALKRLLAAR
jgi:hypothetical protein